jgi:hypothetical protein
MRITLPLSASVVVLAGCGSRDDPAEPEHPTAHAVVAGQVGTRAGDPVAGAIVDLTARGQASGNLIATASTVTGGDGAFVVSVLADSSLPQVTSLEVTVHGPAGAGLATRTVTGATLAFGADDPVSDTLRLMVALDLVRMVGLLYEILPCGLPPFEGPYHCPDSLEVSPGDTLLVGHAVIDTTKAHDDILIRPGCAVNFELVHDGQLIGTLPAEPTCPDSVEVNGYNAPEILNVRGYYWEVPALAPGNYTVRSVWLRDPLDTRSAVLIVR